MKDVLAALEIPEDLVVLAPPILDRTDFGYVADIDLVFLGIEEQKEKLYQKLDTSFGIFLFIIHLHSERLKEIEDELPELYHFLMQRRENIPTRGQIEAVGNYWEEATNLEIKARAILSLEKRNFA